MEIGLRDGAPVMSAVSCYHCNSSAGFLSQTVQHKDDINRKCVLIFDPVSGGGWACSQNLNSLPLFLPLFLSLPLPLSVTHCVCMSVSYLCVFFILERKCSYSIIFNLWKVTMEELQCVYVGVCVCECISLRSILPVAVLEVWRLCSSCGLPYWDTGNDDALDKPQVVKEDLVLLFQLSMSPLLQVCVSKTGLFLSIPLLYFLRRNLRHPHCWSLVFRISDNQTHIRSQ